MYLESSHYTPKVDAAERYELNVAYDIPEEAYIAPEDDHRQPAELADQSIEIESDVGTGRLLVSSTHQLDRIDHEVWDVFLVTHGVKRNAREYRDWMVDSLGGQFDPRHMAVVAPQFTAACDGVNDDVLRWRFHDWRGGEPAEPPSPPIHAFEAKDELVLHLQTLFPNMTNLRIRSNSEGAQQDDRWVAFSRALKLLEIDKVNVEAIYSNAGSVLHFFPIRPRLINPDSHIMNWKFDLQPIAANSLAYRWPFGMYRSSDSAESLIYGPPPYVLDYLQNYTLHDAIVDYAGRTSPAVGSLDNTANGSQLPMEVGPAEQGATRVARLLGKVEIVQDYLASLVGDEVLFRASLNGSLGHTALHNLHYAIGIGAPQLASDTYF